MDEMSTQGPQGSLNIGDAPVALFLHQILMEKQSNEGISSLDFHLKDDKKMCLMHSTECQAEKAEWKESAPAVCLPTSTGPRQRWFGTMTDCEGNNHHHFHGPYVQTYFLIGR